MKTLIKISFLMLLPLVGLSQNAIRFSDKYGPDNKAYQSQNDFSTRRAAAYPFVSEANVEWSRVTWSIIDLRNKSNLVLYYPIDTLQNRKSLINVIMDGIEGKTINPLDQFFAFKTPLKTNAFEFDLNNIFVSVDEIRDLGKRDQPIQIELGPGVPPIDTVVVIRWRPEEITQILVKEVWYFDKKDSRMRSEIIGLCPIREYDYNGDIRRQYLFWIYYPDVRAHFAKIPIYNMRNGRPLYSFDDFFTYRYFQSYFISEENVYNDRLITDYVTGREAQLESKRIEQEIFKYELDQWEY